MKRNGIDKNRIFPQEVATLETLRLGVILHEDSDFCTFDVDFDGPLAGIDKSSYSVSFTTEIQAVRKGGHIRALDM